MLLFFYVPEQYYNYTRKAERKKGRVYALHSMLCEEGHPLYIFNMCIRCLLCPSPVFFLFCFFFFTCDKRAEIESTIYGCIEGMRIKMLEIGRKGIRTTKWAWRFNWCVLWIFCLFLCQLESTRNYHPMCPVCLNKLNACIRNLWW